MKLKPFALFIAMLFTLATASSLFAQLPPPTDPPPSGGCCELNSTGSGWTQPTIWANGETARDPISGRGTVTLAWHGNGPEPGPGLVLDIKDVGGDECNEFDVEWDAIEFYPDFVWCASGFFEPGWYSVTANCGEQNVFRFTYDCVCPLDCYGCKRDYCEVCCGGP